MSSNAFARSRPRVRHQRVPKAQSYTHPRFLQLCKELARLDEAKKKVENDKECGKAAPMLIGINQPLIASNNHCPTDLNPNLALIDARRSQQTSSNCVRPMDNNQPNTSDSSRSLQCNPSCLLPDIYPRTSSSNANRSINCSRQFNCVNLEQQSLRNELNRLNNTPMNLRQHHQDQIQNSRCSAKYTPYPQQQISCSHLKVVPHPQSSEISQNDNDDLRQDENRSKRKRTYHDSTTNDPKSLHYNNCPTASVSKRHKSSPEPARPLSPSVTKCPICLLDCMDRDPSFTNTCFHLFCYACIESWSKSKATCPLCRTKFSKIIYNIRGISCFDEKIASPIRRDEDDDRVIYEHLQSITSSTSVSSPQQPPGRGQNQEETLSRLTFDNLRPSDVLMPQFAFVNPHIDYQPLESLHSFNAITTSNSNTINTVSHSSPFSTYNPYITLIPTSNPSSRLHQPATSDAIASAYAPNFHDTTLHSSTNNEPNANGGRVTRVSRTGRYVYPRNYDLPSSIENATAIRNSRPSNQAQTASGGTSITLERHQQHVQPHHSQNRHISVVGINAPINQPPRPAPSNSDLAALVGSSTNRHSAHRTALNDFAAIPYTVGPPHLYTRRHYANLPVDQHIFNGLYNAAQEPM